VRGGSRPRELRRRAWVAALLAIVLSGGIPPGVAAADPTPPTGRMTLSSVNKESQVIDLRFSFADPESGIDRIEIQCDSGPPAVYPGGTTRVLLPFFAAEGGCVGFGSHQIRARAWNPEGGNTGNESGVTLRPWVHIETPVPAVTGQPFTIAPVFAPGYVMPAGTVCRWDLRWGSDQALFDPRISDGTFGGLLFEGPATSGYCGPWTFTLPHVPLPRFHVTFQLGEPLGDNVAFGSLGFFHDDDRGIVTAAVGSTDPRIRSSNLPIVQVLPTEYIHTVGVPTTYRAYALGGAVIRSTDTWVARANGAQYAFHQTGGTSFTFTPDRAGEWLVGWDAGPGSRYVLSGYYDPPARYRDRTKPRTTAPVVRVGTGTIGPAIPISVSWTGSDAGGWGVASYDLQRSIDGGPHRTVAWRLKARTRTSSLALYHTYRYRVRAIDRAGNVGYYATGPAIRAYLRQETSSLMRWTSGAWESVAATGASGGLVRRSAQPGAAMSYTFTGRGVALIGPRGPDLGQARIYIDGRRVTTVDLNAPTETARAIVIRWHWTQRARHVLRVEVVGTAGHPDFAIDAVLTLG
jgi:hypothetical protein